jgi:hypothetical protein
MSLPQLSLVTAAAETPAARASRLLAEAREAASEQVHVLEQALFNVAEIAHQIAEGGEVYPVGVRELCRRLAEDAAAKSQSMEAMLQASGIAHRR